MVNLIELLKEEISKFQDKDYDLLSKEGKEIYTIHSSELKKVLREFVGLPTNEKSEEKFNGLITNKVEECDGEGNCFSYKGKKEIDDDSPDKLTLKKKEIKQEKTLSPEEIERRRKKMEEVRENALKTRDKLIGIRERMLKGDADYTSRSTWVSNKEGSDSHQQQFQQVYPPEGKY